MKNKFDCLIFDMDGVLIDVSRSYRKAIENTVNYYLAKNGSSNKISQKEVNYLKNQPGFNNDWDTSYRLVTLVNKETLTEIFPVTDEERNTNIFQKIKVLFQIFYLGSELYKSVYEKKALLAGVSGLIESESLLISKQLLNRLKQKYSLAIATGRPRLEALFTLKRFNLLLIFPAETLVAMEDAARAKPFPDPMIEAAKKAGGNSNVYIGDSPNDMEAAEKAGMFSIYVGQDILGDLQINDVNQLEEIFL